MEGLAEIDPEVDKLTKLSPHPAHMTRIWKRATKGGLHSPAWAAVLTVLLAMIGVAGSVFSTEIRSAWPFAAWTLTPTGVSLAACVFWTGLAGTAGLFLVRQIHVDERRAEVDRTLGAAVGEVGTSVGDVQRAVGSIQGAVGEVQGAVGVVQGAVGSIQGAVGEVQSAVGRVGEAVQSVQDSGELLHRVIRTMPPAWFLEVLDAVYERCEALTWDAVVTDSPERGGLVEAIRVVLHGYLHLIEEFDDRPWSPQGRAADEPVRYAANVMVYVPMTHMQERDHSALRDGHLKFWDGSYSDLDGVLDIRADLSAASDSGAEDEDLASFCVPVPAKPKPQQASGAAPWRTLPGAPMAFVTQRPAHFRETAHLARWCREHGDFRQSVLADIEHYFASEVGQRVQSLVAYPLSRQSFGDGPTDGAGSRPIGVLNVHADVPRLLDADEVQSFYATTYPMRLLLLRLLDRLVGLDDLGQAGRWMLSPSLSSANGSSGRAPKPDRSEGRL